VNVSGEFQCVGVCIIDPDTGACMGCGRVPEEISGVPQPQPLKAEVPVPLPANVAAEVGQGSE
jgi:hypothetical protein